MTLTFTLDQIALGCGFFLGFGVCALIWMGTTLSRRQL